MALELGIGGLRMDPQGDSRVLLSGFFGSDRGLPPVPLVSPGTGGAFRRPLRASRARVGGERVRSRS
eukprot:2266557-Heterocapsa_arctica.AAC.1